MQTVAAEADNAGGETEGEGGGRGGEGWAEARFAKAVPAASPHLADSYWQREAQ